MSEIDRGSNAHNESEYSEARLLTETELPIQYTVPFDWGTLRVTEEAHQAYSLVPLREGVHQGDIDVEDRDGVIDVRLIGPEEIPKSCRNENVGLFLFSRLNEEGRLGIEAAFNQDRNESVEKASEMLQSFTGLDDDEFKEMMEDFEDYHDGLPMEVAMRQQIPQLLIHTLSEAVTRPIAQTYKEIKRAEINGRGLRGATAAGSLGLLGGVASALLLGPDIYGEGILTAYATLGFYVARKNMKAFLGAASVIEASISSRAEQMAEAVADGIHETYCIAHFDYENEERLSEG